MADKKIEKALYGPSATEVALGAILGFLLGVLVACIYLTFKPVMTVREPVKEPVAGVVYYQPGTANSSQSRQWNAKQKRFVAGGSIEVNEDELNAWSAAELKKAPAAPAGGKAAAAAPSSGSFLTAQAPNFRIVDGTMQIGFLCKIDYFGLAKEVQVIARGKFDKEGSTFEFDASEFYFGSCPLHKLMGLGAPLMAKLSSLHPPSDEMKAAWAKLSDVQLEGRVLKLTVP